MSLTLIDTSGDDDICYNDVLVKEGYAIFKPDDCTTCLTGPEGAPEVCTSKLIGSHEFCILITHCTKYSTCIHSITCKSSD